MFGGELQVALRNAEGEAPPALVVLGPGANPPPGLPPETVVVVLTEAGAELAGSADGPEVIAVTHWTSAGAWRLRSGVDESSSVADRTSWGVPELRVVRGSDGHPGPTSRLPPDEEGEFVIGRGPEADLTLDDKAVSRRHARIVRRDRRYYLEDSWSKGGTFVGEERIDAARLLRHQDRIRIGKWTLEFFSLLDALEEDDRDAGAREAPEAETAPEVSSDARTADDPGGEVDDESRARRRPWWENAVLVVLLASLLAGIGYVLYLILG